MPDRKLFESRMPADFPNRYPGPTVAFDLDGTICGDEYPGFGPPNGDVILQMAALIHAGWWVIVLTSRPQSEGSTVSGWLRRYDVPYDQLVLGSKPTVDLIVDDKGLLPPIHALDALAHIRGSADWLTETLHDARHVSQWMIEQRMVPENPEYATTGVPYDDPDFRVLIAFSGGIDSLTMANMAMKEGLPFELVYVDVGQPYRTIEYRAAKDLAGRLFGKHLIARSGPVLAESWKHIIPGRNAAILKTVAELAREKGWWGELWFGNLGGESPILGGDKSSRFLLTMQHLFTMEGVDLRLASPLRGLDKPDLIRMWFGWGQINALDKAKSCFDPDVRRCGKCQTCARTLLAYEAFSPGSWQHLFDPSRVGVDMGEHFLKYWTVMPEYLDGKDSRYSPRRARETYAALGRLWERGIWKVQS